MKSIMVNSLIVCLILTVGHLSHVLAVTDAELEALEKQIEQLESEENKKAEVAAKLKADQKRKANAEAEKKRLAELEKKRQEEKARQHKAELKEQKLLEEKRLAEEQRKQEEAERLQQAEIERRIEASLTDFANRSAVSKDHLGYVDNVTAQNLLQTGTKQVSTTISSMIEKWQNGGVEVKRGNTYKISASGQWSIGPFCTSTGPTGDGVYNITCWETENQIVAKRSHAALIGKIGQQSLAFYIGSEFIFTANEDGTLYMMCNDGPGSFFDNSGNINVTVSLVE